MKDQTRSIIEITPQYLKLVQSVHDERSAVLTHCGLLDISGLSDEAIAKKLIALDKTKKLQLKKSEVVGVVSRQNVILRYLNLPSQNRQELSQMVELQIDNHLPYAREDVVLDFMVLNTGADGYSKVLIVIVLKDIVLRLVKILELAKVPVDRVTMSSLGILDWYKMVGKCAGVAVLLDIGQQESEICICDENHLLTSRQVPLGLHMIESQSSEFIKQIDLTVGSYNKEKLGPFAERMEVFSSKEEIHSFCDHLSKEYTMSVEYKRTLGNPSMPLVKPFIWPEGVLSGGPSVTSVMGLSCAHSLKEGINLVPTQVKDAQDHRKERVLLIRLGVIGLATLLTVTLALNLGAMQRRSYLNGLEKQLKEVKAKVSQSEKKTARVNQLKSAVQNRLVFIDVMDEIYTLLPKGISLVAITISDGHGLSLQGVSFHGEEINRFQKALVDSARFSNVNLDYVNKRTTQEGEVNYFKITFQVKAAGSL